MRAYRLPLGRSMKKSAPLLTTVGRIAALLDEPIHRVVYVLATRDNIRPAARAGTLRLYDRRAVAMVRHALETIDARRAMQERKDG